MSATQMGMEPTMAGMPMPPRDLLQMAGQQGREMDMQNQESLSMMAPQGEFSKGAMNRVIGELNKVLALFQESPYPMVEEDITVFPNDLMNLFAMVTSASGDAMVEFDFMPDQIQDDRDLSLLAGKLSKLAKDKDFKRFLMDQSPKDKLLGEPKAEPTPTPTPAPTSSETDMLFAQRM